MGRVKEAVLASLAHPIVSSVSAGILAVPNCQFRRAGILGAPNCQFRQCAMVSVIACFSSYIDHKIRQNIYTRINIHTRQLCESSTRYHSCGF